MKKKPASQSAFFNPRVLIAFVLCSISVSLALAGLTKSVTAMSRTGTAQPLGTSPVPLINQPLVPDAIATGGPGFTLTVNGTGFVSRASVNWNGAARVTTFVSTSHLTTTILASDIANASTATVTVDNPSPAGGRSNAVFFPVTNSAALSFTRTDIPAGSSTLFPATAELNGDGKRDLVVANSSNNTVSVLLGIGGGTFQPPVAYSTGMLRFGTSVRDLNQDGKPDLIVANYGDNTVSVLLGNGDGTFQNQMELPVGNPNSTNGFPS